MSESLLGRVGEQHAAYRKGLVLGLTMAEIGTLIIFVLLLLIANEQLRQDRAMAHFQGKTAIESDRLVSLERAESTLQEIAETLRVEVARPSEDFQRLVRVVTEAAAEEGVEVALVEANQALLELKQAARHVEQLAARASAEGGASIAREVEAQSYRLANQEGQLERYENQLREIGQGKGERPCWVQPDGEIDYLYDVNLTSDGIRLREYEHIHRAAERTLLPMPAVDPAETLTEAAFLQRTAALFKHSASVNCRFFVVVYDSTAEHEKQLYKRLLRTVEGHFYKRNSHGPAPF